MPAAAPSRCACEIAGPRGARRLRPRGDQRLRAHDPDRRAAGRAVRELLQKRTASRRKEEAARYCSSAGRRSPAPASMSCPARRGSRVDRRFNPDEELEQELERLTGIIDDGRGRRRRGRDRRAAGAAVREHRQDHPVAGRWLAASKPSRALPLRSASAPACSRRAGTRSSGSRPSPTAVAAWRWPTGRTSTSTRPPCAAAPPYTPSSQPRDDGAPREVIAAQTMTSGASDEQARRDQRGERVLREAARRSTPGGSVAGHGP